MFELLRYSLKNAPWALITSFSLAASRYVIVLVLSTTYGLEAGGQFRLYLSIIGVLTAFTLMDTGKLVVKYLVLGEMGVVRPLVINRMKWSLIGSLIGIIVSLVFYRDDNALWLPILAGSLLLPITFPPDVFMQINQAQKNFRLNAIYNLIKHGSQVLMCFIFVLLFDNPVNYILIYLLLVTFFNIYYLRRHEEIFQPAHPNSERYKKEGFRLSLSGVLPILLENMDKLLISYFLGLEALGLYTIGLSSGRLFMRAVKAFSSIYFPFLVQRLPARSTVWGSILVLTLLGLCLIWPMHVYFEQLLDPSFKDGFALAAIALAGLGLHAGGILVHHSTIYYRETRIAVPIATNVFIFCLVTVYLLLSALYGGEMTLILFAFSYPLRDLLSIAVPNLMKRLL